MYYTSQVYPKDTPTYRIPLLPMLLSQVTGFFSRITNSKSTRQGSRSRQLDGFHLYKLYNIGTVLHWRKVDVFKKQKKK